MKVKELLTKKSKWTQGAAGRDKEGNPTTTDAELTKEGNSFCLLGAIMRCYGFNTNKYWHIQEIVFNRLKTPKTKDFGPAYVISHWNDDKKRQFKEVKALVKELDI